MPISRNRTAPASQHLLQSIVGFNASLLTIIKPRKLRSSGGHLPAYGTKIQLSGGGAENTAGISRTTPAESSSTPYSLFSWRKSARLPSGPAHPQFFADPPPP